MEKITDKIRAEYPNPVKARIATRCDEYCVLGAACRHFSGDNYYSFPTPLLASGVLGISRIDAERVSWRNDKGDFDAAWDILEAALQNRQKQ